MERVVLIARLKPEGRDRARELIAEHKAGRNTSSDFDRFAIFLAEGEAVFLLEAADAEEKLRHIVNDPVRSSELGPWLPLFDGPLHAAREAYYWERE
jgi:hypothetical protein